VSAETTAVDREVEKAVAFLLRSTRNRPQTEAELRDKLRGRNLPDGVVRAAITRATELGLIDDIAFAKAWVTDRGHQRGYGQARLRQELLRRQVPVDVVDAALADLEQRDEEAVATALAEERFARMPPDLEPDRVARRLVGFLGRKGYPPGIAQRVAKQVSGLDRVWD
jgi:regulatory protein